MYSKIEFSKELQEIHDKSKEIVSAHLECIDQISSDIKALESALKNSALPFEVLYHIRFDNPRYYDLTWNGRRLAYRVWQILEDYPEEITNIPLIEANLRIRISIKDELVFFYQKVMDYLKRYEIQSCVEIVEIYSPNYSSAKNELPF